MTLLALLLGTNGVLADTTAHKPTSLGKLTHDAIQGKQCVIEDTQDMRVNHMNYIVERREQTVQDGRRLPKGHPRFTQGKAERPNYSLELCINCHARDQQAKAVPYLLPTGKPNTQHFCQSCHTQVAVKINCFQCHSPVPTGKAKIITESRNQ